MEAESGQVGKALMEPISIDTHRITKHSATRGKFDRDERSSLVGPVLRPGRDNRGDSPLASVDMKTR